MNSVFKVLKSGSFLRLLVLTVLFVVVNSNAAADISDDLIKKPFCQIYNWLVLAANVIVGIGFIWTLIKMTDDDFRKQAVRSLLALAIVAILINSVGPLMSAFGASSFTCVDTLSEPD